MVDAQNNKVKQQTDEQLLEKLILTLTQMQENAQDPAEIEDVLNKYKLGVEQGDPKAQYHLGLYHETEKQEEVEAIRLYQLAAAQEYAEALFHLGNLYEMGLCGLEQNHPEAVRLYGRAVKQEFEPAIQHLKDLYEKDLYGLSKAHEGYALAQYELGLIYMQEVEEQQLEEDHKSPELRKKYADKYFSRAVELFRLSADQGYAPAQCCVGQTMSGYTNQNDTKVEPFYAPESVRWYRLSAKQDYAPAQYYLGQIYQWGQGKLKKDEVAAARWYQKAADQNHPSAQFALGMMYHEGQGNLEKNDSHALRWLRLAEAGGLREAPYYIDFISNQMQPQTETKHDTEALVALIQQQQTYLEAKKQNAVTKQESSARPAKESKRAEKLAKKKQRKVQEKVQEKEVPKEIKIIPPKTLFYDVLRTKIESLRNMRSKMLEMQKTSAALQVTIIKGIAESTVKLGKALQKRQNNSRLPGLDLNFQSLKDLEKHNHAINEQAEIRNNFLQLCQGFQGTLSAVEYMQLEKRLTTLSIFRWEAFLAVRQALIGEMNDVKSAILQAGLLDLEKEWHDSVKAHAEFLKCMSTLEVLSETVKTRVKHHLAFTECIADANVLSNDKIAEIALKIVAINAKITTLQGDTQKASLNLGAQQDEHASSSPSTRNRRTENTLGVNTFDARHKQNMAGSEPKKAIETNNPAQPIVQKLSKNERIAAYKKNAAKGKALKLKLAQNCSRAVYLKRTQKEIEAGIIPAAERKLQAEQQTTAEISPLLKIELESLQSILNKVQDVELTQKEIYAVLGSLARVNDLVSEEYQDAAIAEVARRLRNAIFKEYLAVEAVVSKNKASFLKMAHSWTQFLEKIAKKTEIGFFSDEEAVLRKLGVESLNIVFYLGKTLDIVAKDDAEFWDIIANNIDVAKCEKSIHQMLDYEGTRGSKDEMISTAARNFYWAIMGSELVVLHEASKRGNRAARKVLKQERFKPLLPYLPEFRDRGVFARHPSAILKENHQVLNTLLAFKSADEPVIAASQTKLNPKAIIFSPTGTFTQITLRLTAENNYPENCNVSSLNIWNYPNGGHSLN